MLFAYLFQIIAQLLYMSSQPNILYFVCHDLGKHLGCYGNPIHTPNLTRFAQQGIQFERAYCTAAACSPSRACAMTGQYANQSGALGLAHMGWPLDESVSTVIEDLRDAGYQTAHAGLAHEWHPNSKRYEVEMARHWDDWQARNAVDDAIHFLKTRKDSRPFYLNVGTLEVHASRFTQPDVVDHVYGGRVPPEDTYLPAYIEDTEANRHFMGGFQSAIEYMDGEFQRLIDALDACGEAENTFVVFTTDHGISTPDVYRSKATCFERGMEISLLIRPPQGYHAGYKVSHLIPNLDFRATFNDIAGHPIPAESEGRSFLPLLNGDAYQPHERLYTERNFHGEKTAGAEQHEDICDPLRSIHTDQYHYIRCFDAEMKESPDPWLLHSPANRKREREYLFDLNEDKMELVNLVHRPEHRHVLNEMRSKLEEWMYSTDDWILSGAPPQPPEPPGWGDWPKQESRTPWQPFSS